MHFEPIEQEPIKAAQEPLSAVFSDKFSFSIPTYQRPYAWEAEQAEALLDDVLAAMSEAVEKQKESVTYFLGSVVIIKQPGSPEAKVIDGQQRLTTLTIMLVVLRDLSATPLVANKRHKLICEEADPDKGTKSRYRLTLRKRDEDFFKDHVQKMGSLATLPESKGLSDSCLRIVENARLFQARLSGMDSERRDTLIAFLLQRCFLVVIAVTNVDMAHRVFTVLNARGLDLTPTDILKADILDRIPAAEETKISDQWEAIEAQLGRDRFVELFQHIRMIYQQEKPRERLEVGFKRLVTDFEQPALFMKRVLQPFGDTLSRLNSNPSFALLHGEIAAKRLRYLHRLDNNDWIPVALKFFAHLNPSGEDATFFMQRLETLAYFLFVMRADINARISRYAKVLKDITAGDWKNGCINLDQMEEKSFLTQLDGPIYEMTRVRLPLLLRLDEELSSGGAVFDVPVISVEHVLPQNPSPDSEWLQSFPDILDREGWTHRLANLVLLTHRKNAQASNSDFSVKKAKYFLGPDGAIPFPLTSQVLMESEWTPDVLRKRQKCLISKLAASWHLQVGPTE